jgi:SWI/SNF-related matrix-associated actin-dependent regulator 1 of chromatin subfamily A
LTKLYKFQGEGVEAIDRLGGLCLLGDEPGLGKSIQTLTWLAENRSALPAVVVCPASVKYHWQREAATHVGMRAEVLSTTRPPRPGLMRPYADLWVINYDILEPWLPYLLALKPRTLVMDECHLCKSWETKRYRAVKQLAEACPFRLGLTGTPILNRPYELWAISQLINPEVFPSHWDFAFKHCRPEKRQGKWHFRGAEALDELHATLTERLMVRRRKSDVLSQLPPKTVSVVPLQMRKPKEYRRAVGDFAGWLNSQGKTAGKRRQEGGVKLGYLLRLVGELKLEALIGWTNDFLAGGEQKLIVFGRHRKVLRPLLEANRGRAVLVDGSVSGEARQSTFDEFTHSGRCRLLIGNLQAAGVGWNGTAAADVALAELGWNPAEHAQAIDRVHRIGQRRPTNAYYLLAKGTVEEDLAELVQRKQKVIDRAVDGGPTADGFDVFDKLMEILARGGK